MSSAIAYTADKIFTGEKWITDHAIIIDGGKIIDVRPVNDIPGGIDTIAYPGRFISPAFIDLQIYGAHGRLLAVYPQADSLSRLNDYCRSGGAAYCMPTVATNTYEVFYQCIDAVRDYWNKGGQGILGLHIEGPWLNPLKKGAHVESLIHAPTLQQVKELLDYGRGIIRIITLAPEVVAPEIIQYICEAGIIVSAGHSNATYEQAKSSFANGIHAVTHLFNAMSPLQHRAPGLAGAAMDDATVMASIIPDGHHVDYAAIRIAKAVMKDRLFVITDAVTTTTEGNYPHHLAGDKYESNGILSGSALKTNQAVRNLVKHVGLDLAEALRMCSLYPARVLHQPGVTGKIEPGSDAKMVVLDDDLAVTTMIG